MRDLFLPFAFSIFVFAFFDNANAAPVLVISIDGLGADDLEQARQGKLKIPAIQALMAEGVYATRVKGVLPSVTYPSHTTLLTGVAPDVHGIEGNIAFDPFEKNKGGWNWYSSDIRVPTLWDIAHRDGKKVASVNWPVSVGSPSIDYNVPEFWLARSAEDVKILRALSPELMPELEKAFSTENGRTLSTPFLDKDLADMAAYIFETKHPDLTTLHITQLDHARHIYGPQSKEALQELRKTDAIIGDLIARTQKKWPGLVIAIVSDHGFAEVEYEVNLFEPFLKEGLITLDKETNKVAAFKAMPRLNGGSAAIVLKDPSDKITRAQVAKLLESLKSDQRNGIAGIKQNDSVFWVDFKLGFQTAKDRKAPLVSRSESKGMHGYFPSHPQMDSVFILAGNGLSRKGSLGTIDMRDIAPTIAKVLGVTIPSATGVPLP